MSDISRFPPRIFMDEYYRRKPGRLCERMEDTWCPEYSPNGTKTQEYVPIEEFNAALSEMDKEFFLKIVRDWKHSWMNQTQNSKEDFRNYFGRAFGIDSNMVHSLAHRLEKAIKERGKR